MSLSGSGLDACILVDGGWRSPSRARTTWDAARREEYLLRDVDFPVSWDRRVLPTVTSETAESDDFELFAMILPDPNAPEILSRWRIGQTFSELPARAFEWLLLGYDVCDEAGLSGLTNCGSNDIFERAAHARKWAPLLNQLHLLDSESHANGFRIELNARVVKHAPFLVHRLYRGTPRG
jgi:hypothetical protein